ncbi:PAS domain S-box protein [Clostridiales bacterium COT073_COT-073]|nr:PAS domain S-box protein [Clostridiales bacterium COT073_COT-073]
MAEIDIEMTKNCNLYKIIVDNSYDAIVVSDAKGKIVVANKTTLESMCLSEEEVLGKTPQELISQGIYTNSTIVQAIATGEPVTGLVNVHGKPRLSTSLPLFDENGDLEYVITNNRSGTVMDEFANQLAYEQQQHTYYRTIADYLNNYKGEDIVCNSPQMMRIMEFCVNFSASDSPVMLLGESGVGKELIAWLIHSMSARKKQAFIPVNCLSVSQKNFENELFGEQGTFFSRSGSKQKMGLLRMAHKGTMFLDEVSELSLSMQSKLLRFIEKKELENDNRHDKLDVRIICATNRDLKQMIKEKTFREDLYYHLNVIPIQIPPLRERPEDIEAISHYFLRKYNKKYGKQTVLSPQNLDFLKKYDWPGNVRELRNVIEHSVLMSAAHSPHLALYTVLNQEDNLNQQIDSKPKQWQLPEPNLPLEKAVALFEEKYIQSVIECCNGQLQAAAKVLGIHRSTLYRKQNKE